MKKTFVPLNKQSKKARKGHYSAQRSTWGILNPATRTMPNGKAYNRKKQKAHDRSDRESYFDSMPLSFYLPHSSSKSSSSIIPSKIVSSIIRKHSSDFFSISFPQNLMTVQPRKSNSLLTSSSCSMFLAIFFTQKSPLFPCSN